jgi:hypothetical protein
MGEQVDEHHHERVRKMLNRPKFRLRPYGSSRASIPKGIGSHGRRVHPGACIPARASRRGPDDRGPDAAGAGCGVRTVMRGDR